ncbi:protein of unknown function DUF547 [Hymenobacter roseosalivarius DSM 11622]|uniref:DUF547 domain-containing protein n=1 Tax=Hymenobacter roseosalivarius DSM 11622 TaxID=645990 RepID=A0A1W1W0Y6_9BACT|nr:DUF547 domain-containing protein [Hymenobacter roseosalivarius]SMB99258.1 protein of unknown function DUF547 [Hymenobacter roseosalivarius DSM 11622]
MSPLSRLAIFGLLLFTAACQSGCAYVRYFTPLNPTSKDSRPVSHAPWDALLQKHVNEQGMVNYAAFQADSAALNTYLTTLSDNLPSDQWSDQERLAYWLNAYNAFTIQRVLRAYPLKSIKDLGGDKTLVNTVWDQPFIRLGNDKHTLNDIEQRIIRKRFEEPRIHFALVCAAMSCPKLRNEAYVAARLNQQLDEQATEFVNNPAKNKLTPADKPEVSSIFSYYPKDFAKDGNSIQKTINRYATQKINPDATLSYMTYDWALNEQGK